MQYIIQAADLNTEDEITENVIIPVFVNSKLLPTEAEFTHAFEPFCSSYYTVTFF